MSKHVVIVGAGASGLIAARELSKQFKVTVLEARQVCGGRIRSFYLPQLPQVLEAGPEFVHGKLPVTMSLFREAGIATIPLEGKMYRKVNGILKAEEEMVEGWDILMKKMKQEPQNLTILQFLDKHFAEPKHAELRKQMIAYAGGFDLADPSTGSIKELYQEWANEGETFRIPAGYVSLINFLESECLKNGVEMIKGVAVTGINWKQNHAEIITVQGRTFTSDKVIVTLPLSHLIGENPAHSITFNPSLSNYTSAFKKIGFGTVIKVMIHFEKPFWNHDAGFILSDEQIPTWWSLMPIVAPVLTGWAGGPAAAALAQLTDEELLETALVSLSSIFTIPAEVLRNGILNYSIFNWQKDATALGAYSFSTPDSASSREILNTPVDNTIYFAGEALYSGNYPGTVEAALTTGKNVAKQILKEH